MPVSESTAIPSSLSYSLELDPLLRDLVEKKLSLKRNVTAMATELKDSRNRLASKELLLAQELEARKVCFILCNWSDFGALCHNGLEIVERLLS